MGNIILTRAFKEDRTEGQRDANQLLMFFRKYGDHLEWITYDGRPWMIGSSLAKAKGLEPKDFSKNYIGNLTSSITSEPLLKGIRKLESDDLAKAKRMYLEQHGKEPSWIKASSIYICTWQVAIYYLGQGYSELSQDLNLVSAQLVEKEITITSEPPRKPTRSGHILSLMKHSLEVLEAHEDRINELDDKYDTLESKEALLDQRISELEHKASYTSIKHLANTTIANFTPKMARNLGQKCAEYCQLRNIDYYHYPDENNQYPKSVIKAVVQQGLKDGVYKSYEELGNIFYYLAYEDSPNTPFKERKNFYKGTIIKPKQIVELVHAFRKGYNDIEGTHINEYQIWSHVLHPKIKEITDVCPRLAKQYYGKAMHVLENQGKLPILYDYMLPYIHRGNELIDETRSRPPVCGKTHLAKIRAGEAKKKSSKTSPKDCPLG